MFKPNPDSIEEFFNNAALDPSSRFAESGPGSLHYVSRQFRLEIGQYSRPLILHYGFTIFDSFAITISQSILPPTRRGSWPRLAGIQ